MTMEPAYRVSFEATKLLQEYPPKFRHPYKTLLFALAYPPGTLPAGELEITRWMKHVAEPLELSQGLSVDVQANFYEYKPVAAGESSLEWHVNFADPRLFVAYGSGLFAQDEMQVAEHPLLGSVCEALKGKGLAAKTCDKSGGTPVLVRNVERCLSVSTEPDAAAGRPFGLYGNQFANASEEAIRRATQRLDPPTFSNLIAIAAPSFGHGEYTASQVEYAFTTAFTGFAAARQESQNHQKPVRSVVHSGFWGCGAFGGNRQMMIALQALAARAAGIEKLVLHAGNREGVVDAQSGIYAAERISDACGSECTLSTLVDCCVKLNLIWGVSDGN